MRQVSCSRCHATLALNAAFAVGSRVAYVDTWLASVERAFASAGSSGQRE
jgi:hypothetical protein